MDLSKLYSTKPFSDKTLNWLLRGSLAVVYIWFGLLKIFNISPVAGLIQALYPSFTQFHFIIILGVWEVVIGVGFLAQRTARWAVYLMWLQMVGIFAGLVVAPDLFFSRVPWILTTDGEFVIKNLVLLVASLVVLRETKE